MNNKILLWLKDAYKPLYKILVKYGWELRLLKRKKEGNFVKLSKEQKKEIKDYWKSFGKNINPDWVAYFYTMSGIYDKKYIPESYYYSEIQPYLNDHDIGWILSDKNIASQIFNAKMPRTIVRKINNKYYSESYSPLSFEEVVDLITVEKEVILKPSNNTYGGEGILFWNDTQEIKKLKRHLRNSQDIIVQEIIQQHKELSKYHPSSLNTVRIVTLNIDNKILVLNSILRIGVNDSKIDNFSAGGIISNIDKSGYLFAKSTQSDGKKISEHPDTKINFSNQSIPNFQDVIKNIIAQHNRVPYFRLISWDYTVNEKGDPILIEANYPSGQLDLHQFNIGTLFGEYTDDVLREIYLQSD